MTPAIGEPVEADHSIDNLLAAVRDLLDSDPRSALDHAEMLLPSTPDPRVFRLAAEACRRLGMADEAEDAELAAIQAGFRSPRSTPRRSPITRAVTMNSARSSPASSTASRTTSWP